MYLDDNWHVGPERRRRRRVFLHWTVYLWPRDEMQPYQAETTNISSDGFYCVAPRPFTPGEWIECDIFVPTMADQNDDDLLVLRCRVQVLRVETTGNGDGYGLACRIEDYSLGKDGADPGVAPRPPRSGGARSGWGPSTRSA